MHSVSAIRTGKLAVDPITRVVKADDRPLLAEQGRRILDKLRDVRAEMHLRAP